MVPRPRKIADSFSKYRRKANRYGHFTRKFQGYSVACVGVSRVSFSIACVGGIAGRGFGPQQQKGEAEAPPLHPVLIRPNRA